MTARFSKALRFGGGFLLAAVCLALAFHGVDLDEVLLAIGFGGALVLLTIQSVGIAIPVCSGRTSV
jgi:hypothetical protein